jgi:hypothetical protein
MKVMDDHKMVYYFIMKLQVELMLNGYMEEMENFILIDELENEN